MNAVVYDATTGEVHFVHENVSQPPNYVPNGLSVLMVSEVVRPNEHKVVDGAVIPYSIEGVARRLLPPGRGFVWDGALEQWVDSRSLEERRTDMWEEVKRVRDQQFATPSITSHGVTYIITKDDANLLKLRDIRLAGAVPASYPSQWMDQANVPHDLDQAGLDLLTFEMGMRGQAIFTRSWQLRASIESAVSHADLDAIDVNSGWPS